MIEEKSVLEIKQIVGEENCLENESMKNHTTFRIGGPARLFVAPDSVDKLKNVIAFCKEKDIKVFIIGNGSNLLVSDKGLEGVVIQIYRNFSGITINGNEIIAQSGELLSSVAAKAMENSLTGFEFASGIPGTLGGAVVMNAGAYGGEMSRIVKSVTILNQNNEIQVLNSDELNFGYRKSAISAGNDIVLSVAISLQKGDKEQIRAKMEELRDKRVSKQPLNYPSAGSTFKRPEGYYAGKLIMDAGFKGYRVGGAQVSEKHCGFVINTGDAKASDVIELTNEIKKKVLEEKNISLELEVKMIGEF